MSSLLEWQRGFAAALAAPRAGLSRMAIYRGNVDGNRKAALSGAYPVLCRIVGEAFFDQLAADYARTRPSASGDLNEYGEGLATFLEARPDVADVPYLPDVARLEWQVHRAYYAADPEPFDPSRPTDVRVAPACALLAAEWPVVRIWREHQEGGDPRRVDLSAGAELALVYRPVWRVAVLALQPGDYRFLARLMAGAGLGAALEAATAVDASFQPRAALAAWVQAGVITA